MHKKLSLINLFEVDVLVTRHQCKHKLVLTVGLFNKQHFTLLITELLIFMTFTMSVYRTSAIDRKKIIQGFRCKAKSLIHLRMNFASITSLNQNYFLQEKIQSAKDFATRL